MDKLAQAHKELTDAAAKMLAAAREAERKHDLLKAAVGKLGEFEKYPDYPHRQHYSTFSGEESPQNYRNRLDRWLAECELVGKRNAVVAENNRAVVSRLDTVFTAAGMPPSVLGPVKRNKREWEAAGWKRSLQQVRTDDGMGEIRRQHSAAIEKLDKEIKLAEEKAAQRERDDRRQAEIEEKARRKQLVIVALAGKYELDPLKASIEDIRDAILAKDKYAHLAYWMQRNRGDWSEGSHFAEIGLRHFMEIQSTDAIDMAIVGEISRLCGEAWDGDGRCFRDCTWNYDKIMGLADSGVAEDLAQVLSFEELY